VILVGEWLEKRMDEIADFNPRESIQKGATAKKIAMDKLQPFCRDVPGYEMEAFSGGTKFRNGDTIMARITPCLENGKTAKVDVLDEEEVGFGSTEYIVFRAKEGNDPDFIYYLVTSPVVREPAIKSMVGSSGRQRVQTDVVQGLKVRVPDLEGQQAIASVLKVLDDKIAANRKVNENLTEQARAIFQAWFIDYEPFGGAAPLDWHPSTLGQIAEIKTDSWSPTKNPDVVVEHYSIPAFDEQHYPVFEIASGIKSNKYILSSNSVMISKLNPDTKRIWRPMCLSEHPICSTEFIVYEAKKQEQKDYIYSILDSVPFLNHLCSHTTGSTNSRQRATPKSTLDFTLCLPPDSVIEDFCHIVTPMYDLIASNIVENQSLAKARDSLLPRLMSGEIDVSAVQL
jgi:type I restriction enzyme S subunit